MPVIKVFPFVKIVLAKGEIYIYIIAQRLLSGFPEAAAAAPPLLPAGALPLTGLGALLVSAAVCRVGPPMGGGATDRTAEEAADEAAAAAAEQPPSVICLGAPPASADPAAIAA